jgi:hypothetical protein
MMRRRTGTTRPPPVALLAACLGGLALAGTAPPRLASAAPRDEARTLIKQGNALLGKGDCAKALEQFRKARAVFPESHKIHVNLATALDCLGQRARAAEHFEAFVSTAEGPAETRMARAVEAKLSALRKQLARMALTCPDDSEVILDGEAHGRSPLASALYAEPGAHTVLVRYAGKVWLSRRVALSAGESVDLKPSPRAPRVAPPRTAAPAAVAGLASPADAAPSPEPGRAAPTTSPFFKRWWFWTVVGVVVVGATVGAVVATQTGGSSRLPAAEGGTITF